MGLRQMIEHAMTRRHLDAYVDNEIVDPALAEKVARHIAACPVCNADAETTSVVKHRLSLRRFLPRHASNRTTPNES
jgi:anti-sigma factor RsiW